MAEILYQNDNLEIKITTRDDPEEHELQIHKDHYIFLRGILAEYASMKNTDNLLTNLSHNYPEILESLSDYHLNVGNLALAFSQARNVELEGERDYFLGELTRLAQR